MNKPLPIKAYLISFLIVSCERNESVSSDDGAGTRLSNESANINNEQSSIETMDFEAALWLRRNAGNSFEINGAAGQLAAIDNLKRTLAQLNYEHFAEDSRVEGVIITRRILRDERNEFKKIQIRHIPVINGVVNIGDQKPIFTTPEIFMQRIDLARKKMPVP